MSGTFDIDCRLDSTGQGAILDQRQVSDNRGFIEMEKGMGKRDIWIAFAKTRPLPGCDLNFDGCEFYFCEAYVPVDGASSPENVFKEIIGKTRNGLLDIRFELVDISKIIRFDAPQWEVISDNGNDVHEFAQSAEACEYITFSGFRSEEIEEETQYKHTISNR